jgi:hypothetical protein
MSPRRSAPSTADLHRAWLELVDADGPFLSVPVLKRAWSTGMLPPGSAELDALRDAKPTPMTRVPWGATARRGTAG